MKYVIYKTTNKINGKIYVGFHTTNNIDDGYLGSGKILKFALKKYGVENFSKEILFESDNKEDAFKKEGEIVNQKFVKNKNTYNIKVGGEGGWDYINEKRKNNIEFSKQIYEKSNKTFKQNFLDGKIKRVAWNKGLPAWNKGLKNQISEETRKKISENNANKLSKEKITTRINDFNKIEKKRGYVMKLSKKWKVSHSQVRKFINKYINK